MTLLHWLLAVHRGLFFWVISDYLEWFDGCVKRHGFSFLSLYHGWNAFWVKWRRWILCFTAAFFLLLKEFLGRFSSIGLLLEWVHLLLALTLILQIVFQDLGVTIKTLSLGSKVFEQDGERGSSLFTVFLAWIVSFRNQFYVWSLPCTKSLHLCNITWPAWSFSCLVTLLYCQCCSLAESYGFQAVLRILNMW